MSARRWRERRLGNTRDFSEKIATGGFHILLSKRDQRDLNKKIDLSCSCDADDCRKVTCRLLYQSEPLQEVHLMKS